jgi:predicted AAA+ superfamily ATPase
VSNPLIDYQRPQGAILAARLREPTRFIQVVAGPRQVGKTTMVQQVTAGLGLPVQFASADEPSLRGAGWLAQQWNAARLLGGAEGSVLVLDEVQKVTGWSEAVKRLWDEDARKKRAVKVVLLGSAPLLIQRGLSESLAGRFEVLQLPHWALAEMQAAFGWSLDQYLFSRDVLLLTRVDKPALLRRLFELGCRYSGQILSYTKMLGQLQDAGNTVTLAHYLDLLAGAGMVMGLSKYAGAAVRQRGSTPKLQVLNTGLTTSQTGLTMAEARADPEFWGRLTRPGRVPASCSIGVIAIARLILLSGRAVRLLLWRSRADAFAKRCPDWKPLPRSSSRSASSW